jgi:hypothetical protein
MSLKFRKNLQKKLFPKIIRVQKFWITKGLGRWDAWTKLKWHAWLCVLYSYKGTCGKLRASKKTQDKKTNINTAVRVPGFSTSTVCDICPLQVISTKKPLPRPLKVINLALVGNMVATTVKKGAQLPLHQIYIYIYIVVVSYMTKSRDDI